MSRADAHSATGPHGDSLDAIVVGGGLAGIATALGLAEHGAKVALLESKRTLGGRAGSFEEQQSGQSIDYCQHVGMHCCSNLRKLTQLLGQEPDWLLQKKLYFQTDRQRTISVGGTPLPSPLHLANLLKNWPGLRLMQRFEIARTLLRLFRTQQTSPQLASSATNWLVNNGASHEAISAFWQTIVVSALGDRAENVSMRAVRKVLVDGFAKNRSASWLLIPERPLQELFGSYAQARLIDKLVDVRLQSRVQKIARVQAASHQDQWQVTLDSQSSLLGRNVVLAVPWYRVRNVHVEFRPSGSKPTRDDQRFQEIVARISGLGTSPITGIHTWWDRPWMDSPNAILVDAFCQWVFKEPISRENPSEHQIAVASDATPANASEHYYQIVVSGSHDLRKMSSAQIIERVTSELPRFFKQCEHARLLRHRIVTDPFSVFSLSEAADQLRPMPNTFKDQGLWLAGDWVQTDWPATMESAIRSGFMVADAIAEQSPNSNGAMLQSETPSGWLSRLLMHTTEIPRSQP